MGGNESSLQLANLRRHNKIMASLETQMITSAYCTATKINQTVAYVTLAYICFIWLECYGTMALDQRGGETRIESVIIFPSE